LKFHTEVFSLDGPAHSFEKVSEVSGIEVGELYNTTKVFLLCYFAK